MSDVATLYINKAFNYFYNKIIVPGDFHGQVTAVKDMLKDDMSGIADSLTDFQVNSASVRYSIETNNSNLNEKLNNWLSNWNNGYNGQIPRGIDPIAEEYFKERWKASSFPVLKIAKWEYVDGLELPIKLYFLDGGSIYAKDTDSDQDVKKLIGYEYYLGRDLSKADGLTKDVIITKPYGRLFDEYPVPYLIKRGVYHNCLIIESLKAKQADLLEQVIPYILWIQKGSEGLEKEGKSVEQKELDSTMADYKEMISKLSASTNKRRTTARVSKWDEKIIHLIPEMIKLFEPALFSVAEKNILCGLGLLDIAQPTSDSRRESILNPKPFITETKKGVEDFKNYILKELVYRIIERNKDSHSKYMSKNITFKIRSSPMSTFITDAFRQELRLLWKHGLLSNQTYCEVVGETEYEFEVVRRDEETKKGHEIKMYPRIVDNKEGIGLDVVGEDIDKNGQPKSPDKMDNTEKFNMSSLEIAIYNDLTDLPDYIRKKFNKKVQRKWMVIWNNAYYYMLGKSGDKKIAETYAYRVANSQVKAKVIQKAMEASQVEIPINAAETSVKLEDIVDKISQIFDEKTKGLIEDLKKDENRILSHKKSKLLDKLLGKEPNENI